MRNAATGDRLIALFLLGVLLFSAPMMAIFNLDTLVLGIPLLYLYLFGAWLLLVAVLALVLNRHREPVVGDGPPGEGG
jgi:hypothetical protein